MLYEFVGANSVLPEPQVEALITAAGLEVPQVNSVISGLRASSFLGVEVRAGVFEFPDAGPEMRKADVLARRVREWRGGEQFYSIHPAYRAYLEVEEHEGY